MCLKSLQVLGCPTQHWDNLIVVILERKLDPVTRREWAKQQTGSTLSSVEESTKFVTAHIRGLQAVGGGAQPSGEKKSRVQLRTHHTYTRGGACPVCPGSSHSIYDCQKFISSTPPQRSQIIRKARVCYNCLRGDHFSSKCSSPRKCKKCGARHHTLLHEDKPKQEEKKQETTEVQETRNHHVSSNNGLVLKTAVVAVEDRVGNKQFIRVMLDNGSQGDFITSNCADRLQLPRSSGRVRVTGVGGVEIGTTRGIISTTLLNREDSSKSLAVDLYVVSRLTDKMPSFVGREGRWRHLEGIQLADPQWAQPGHIDVLLGIRYEHLFMLTDRKLGRTDNDPVAWATIFGYVISGACPARNESELSSYQICCDNIDKQIRKFWEMEEPPQKRIITQEEKQCEEHFLKTYKRNENGRFVVAVPFNETKLKLLGASRGIACKRLYQVERRLNRNPSLRHQYVEFMREYEAMGHMSLVPPEEVGEQLGKTNFLCHHFVVNESSSTTKLRVVFDGSASTATGISMNETILVGATLQDDIMDLLLRFRIPEVVLKADIAKMFRQFELIPEHRDLHRILWRESPEQPVKEYRLNTVTYGTAYAPNLAVRCLKQLAIDCREQFPEAARVLDNSCYVDDTLCGTSTVAGAVELYRQLSAAVATAGLELRKWCSNSNEVLQMIPEDARETKAVVFDEEEMIKALGVQWLPGSDEFKFKAIKFSESTKITKRVLLSQLASLFDPLGLITCVALRGKLILQELWRLSVGWDDELPQNIVHRWEEFKSDLEMLPNLSIPRQIVKSGAVKHEYHGFADSSELGFGAVVYLRNIFPDGCVTVRYITGKSRVTPVRQITLPRLELCAAVLLAELVSHLQVCLQLEGYVHLWSDSSITLMWIAASPRRWKTFVGNRVARIQELFPVSVWKHVAGVENPADLASRGASVQELLESDFWWTGPSWLSQQEIPTFPVAATAHPDTEERKEEVQVNLITPKVEEHPILLRYSKLSKLNRVTAWYIRYLRGRRHKNWKTGELTVAELQAARMVWVHKTQQHYFLEDIKSIQRQGHVRTKSKLKTLFPFFDQQDILRVGGRVRNADIPEEGKHQVILPGESHLTRLLIDHCHEKNFHGGFQLTWSSVQQQYWIVSGRDRVRHFVRSCVRCICYREKAAQQLMGNLPAARVTPSGAFVSAGVDNAGLFLLKDMVGRVPKVHKSYMCLFVCLATKAIHLEAVSSLSTEAFLASLRRFVGRRGLCSHLYSDCGTNFVGADKELQAIIVKNNLSTAVSKQLADDGIEWKFNTPAAPHHGGLWEAGVKSAKGHLRRVIGNTPLTFEEFTTVLVQIEAVLNTRPLYAMSSDPMDLQPLTPAHFLTGERRVMVPDEKLLDIPRNRLSQFQRLQQQLQQFWQRWSRDYLNTLQQRHKWMWEKNNVNEGDLVLLVEETPPGTWKMARVIKVNPGADGRVRVATIRTSTSTLDRPITKLIPLLKDES